MQIAHWIKKKKVQFSFFQPFLQQIFLWVLLFRRLSRLGAQSEALGFLRQYGFFLLLSVAYERLLFAHFTCTGLGAVNHRPPLSLLTPYSPAGHNRSTTRSFSRSLSATLSRYSTVSLPAIPFFLRPPSRHAKLLSLLLLLSSAVPPPPDCNPCPWFCLVQGAALSHAPGSS